jgi:hypothetical protein
LPPGWKYPKEKIIWKIEPLTALWAWPNSRWVPRGAADRGAAGHGDGARGAASERAISSECHVSSAWLYVLSTRTNEAATGMTSFKRWLGIPSVAASTQPCSQRQKNPSSWPRLQYPWRVGATGVTPGLGGQPVRCVDLSGRARTPRRAYRLRDRRCRVRRFGNVQIDLGGIIGRDLRNLESLLRLPSLGNVDVPNQLANELEHELLRGEDTAQLG